MCTGVIQILSLEINIGAVFFGKAQSKVKRGRTTDVIS